MSSKGGTAAITKITMPRNTIAPSVSASAFPRLATKPDGSSFSWATWIAVRSAAMPPDALHNAMTTAMTSVNDTPARLALAIDDSWKTRKSCTSLGSAEAMSWT